jgi:hypothetical protein
VPIIRKVPTIGLFTLLEKEVFEEPFNEENFLSTVDETNLEESNVAQNDQNSTTNSCIGCEHLISFESESFNEIFMVSPLRLTYLFCYKVFVVITKFVEYVFGMCLNETCKKLYSRTCSLRVG